ncbi:MAG: LytR family transcriptional regulator [Coprococcus sp.]|nr:LytR family transcriptional regulator [Coprococcus sp.]
MEQRRSGSPRRGSDYGNSNRNERNISNSREVSRRSKGKSRYAYEEDRRAARYHEDDYYRAKPKKAKSSGYAAKIRDDDMRHSARRGYTGDNGGRKRKRRGRNKNGVSKTIGIIFAIIQFVLSVFLVVNVLFFGMLPNTYILVLIGVLLILLGITLLTQIGAKGKGVGGKVFSVVLSAILGFGSFLIGDVNNAFDKILDSTTKTSSMVVAVRKDDTAEQITDAEFYNFGVQYTTSADQTRTVVSQIEKELGGQIETVEYNDLIEEAQALYNREVDAIIFNAGQSGVIENQLDTFSDDIKIIYKHNIVVEIESNAVDTSVNEPFAMYLSGIDVYGDITQESRSDVNIVAVVNPKSHQILLVTTPRDYYVTIPEISNGQYDKLTHAGTYGVDASMRTLGSLYDVEIPFYGRVNFTSMINIVDALGGLDVESDQAFTTSRDSEHVMDVQEGMNHFNGEEALAFCRERQNLPDGDNARGRHQQAVITAIIQKMMSPAMLRAATGIIESVSDGVDTNFTMEQVQALIKNQLRTNATWHIYSVAAEGESAMRSCYSSGSMELSVMLQDDTSVANISNLIDRVIDGEVLEESTTIN